MNVQRFRSYWALVLVPGALAAAAACQPGKLSDTEEQNFQKALKKYYGETAATSAPRATASAPATSAPATSAQPSAAPTPTAAPLVDAAASASSSAAVEAGASPTDQADGGGGTPPSLVFSECALEVFATTCSGTVCHYAGVAKLPPDLERPDLAQVLATEMTNCPDAPSPLFVDPADPLSSYLWLKMQGTQPVNCGDDMPPSGLPQLDATQLKCLEDWFASLAP
jgi:hypothetical protein